MNNKNKIIVFIGILILFSISLFLTTKNFLDYSKYNKMNVIVETIPNNKDDILLKIDNNIYFMPLFKNVLNKEIRTKAGKISILVKENYRNEIKNIVVFNDTKMNIFDDFSKFKKTKEKLCSSEKCQNYNSYEFNDDIKYVKNSKVINYNSKINTFSLLFNNFIEGNLVFIIPYILLFIAIVYFIQNQEYLSFKLENKICFLAILALILILRFNNLNSYIPWGDECYSILISNPKLPLINLFNDPGNPPFYYFILRINLLLFNMSYLSARVLSIFFSVLAYIFLWKFAKNKFNLKIANILIFLCAINTPLIYYSQEIRCYSLQVFLSVLIFIYLFKILSNGKIKDYIIYFFLIAMAINTHYYQILFVGLNFFFIVFYLLKEKRKKELITFCVLNFVAIMTFLPFYIMTAHNQALLNESFNTQLPKITLDLTKNCIYTITGGLLPLIFTCIFMYKNFKINKSQYRILCYCIYIIFFVVFLGLILSLTIRPMFTQRYLVFLIPFYLIIVSYIFGLKYKNRYIYLFFVFWIMISQNYLKDCIENTRKLYTTSYSTFKIARHYEKSNPKKEILLILRPSDFCFSKFWELYGEKYGKNIKQIYAKELANKVDIEKSLQEKINKAKKQNMVIFTPLLKANKENSIKKNYTCYFNSALDICIWKIE